MSDSDGIGGDSAGDKMKLTIDLGNTGSTTLTAIDISSVELRNQVER